ncbi:hypothetical protein ABT009_28660 [Streptomyces sp. NPDC002896]|uniref:hypothetical protein n=1 Tax=Streptomyces sp. NPDC002896 TaxID=3154438 RepID=UPI0033249ED4
MVDKDLVAACAQERMLMEPDFWLGPAMVSLAARHLHKAPQMRRARAQAYSLDQARSNLFFTLTCTRLGELDEAARWMDRYLQSLDPYALDEDFHVVLDAVACNELGAQAHAYTRQAMERWLDRLGLAQASTLTNQVAHHMGELGEELPEKRFEELSRVCAGDWDELRRGWEWATIPAATLTHLHRAFPGDQDKDPAGHAASALDALIDRHDADEATLASRMRYLELVVEHGGDEKAASGAHGATGRRHPGGSAHLAGQRRVRPGISTPWRGGAPAGAARGVAPDAERFPCLHRTLTVAAAPSDRRHMG